MYVFHESWNDRWGEKNLQRNWRRARNAVCKNSRLSEQDNLPWQETIFADVLVYNITAL